MSRIDANNIAAGNVTPAAASAMMQLLPVIAARKALRSIGLIDEQATDYWLARSHRFDHLRREHDGRACVQVGSTWFQGAGAFGVSSQADTGDTAANTTAAAYGWPPGTPGRGADLSRVARADRQRYGTYGLLAAINRGDRVAASALADQVLAVDGGNAEAEDLLTAPGDAGEIRRLTILFADMVDSTVSGHGHRIDDQHRRVPVVGVFSRANAYRTR